MANRVLQQLPMPSIIQPTPGWTLQHVMDVNIQFRVRTNPQLSRCKLASRQLQPTQTNKQTPMTTTMSMMISWHTDVQAIINVHVPSIHGDSDRLNCSHCMSSHPLHMDMLHEGQFTATMSALQGKHDPYQRRENFVKA